MKVLRFSSEEIARLFQPFRYALVGKFSHGYPSMQHLRRWMLAQGFRGDFSVGAINARHVFIKFALKEDYTKLWLKSICIARLLGTPLQTDVSTTTLMRPSVARVCVKINLLEPLLTDISLGFGTEMIMQPVVYERLLKYCATSKHLGNHDDECYEKIKNRGPARSVEGDDQRTSDHVDLREKLDAQRAQRELHPRRKGKRVVFEDVHRRPEASSSGAKGAKDGSVAMKLQDTMHEPEPKPAPEPEPEPEPEPQPQPQPLFHEEAGIADVATCPLEPAVPEEPLPQDDLPECVEPVCVEPHPDTEDVALCPSGESTLQSDTEAVTKRLARHPRGGLWEKSLRLIRLPRTVERGVGNAPTQRILNRVRKQHHLDFLAIMEPMVTLDGQFMARRLGFLDVVSNCGNQIWFFWGPDVRCQVLVDHEQLLHVWIESNKWLKPLFVTAVYAKCDTIERRALWDALRAVLVGASSWIVGDCAIVDVGYVGSPYTWYSRRLRQRLDQWRSGGSRRLMRHMIRILATARLWSAIGVLLNWFEFWPRRRLFGGRRQHEGEYLTDPIAIKNSAASFFQRLLTAEPVFPEKMYSEHLEDGLTDEDRRFLCVMPMLEEVREAVFSIDPDSVVGPDGFGAVFFHTCWEIISDDVFGAVTEFSRGVKMPKGFTATTISLIPKTASPTCWSEYRPISLCNVTNKICTKLMTIRLWHVLSKLVHSLESRWPDANVVFKLAMIGSVGISSIRFFHSTHGLRQGYPLSPALFVLAVDYLSRGLERLFAAHPTMFYQAPGLVRVSHLAYADDLMIFTTTCRQNIELLRDFLRAYERVSGQLINGSKSSFIVGRQVSSLQTQAVQDVLGYQLKHLPVTYLGVPSYKGNRKACLFDPIISRLRDLLQGWAMTNLSHGGRLALIRSVLQATPLHLLQDKSSLWSEYLHGSYCQNLHPTIVPYNRFGEKPLAQLLHRDTYTMEPRNAAKYRGYRFSPMAFILEVQHHLRTLYAARTLTSTQWKGDLHQAVIMGFIFRQQVPRAPSIVRWHAPSPSWFKDQCVGRAHSRLAGMELALTHGLAPLVVEVDATTVISLLKSRASGKWEVQPVFREANGAADHLVKKFSSLQLTRVLHHDDIT
ncbi:UNVERIFIED_CONTAM: hypothetical protein Sangu_3261400, partial [Sesamum angustifolium]